MKAPGGWEQSINVVHSIPFNNNQALPRSLLQLTIRGELGGKLRNKASICNPAPNVKKKR